MVSRHDAPDRFPARCTCREPVGIEPGRLPLVAEPATYLTAQDAQRDHRRYNCVASMWRGAPVQSVSNPRTRDRSTSPRASVMLSVDERATTNVPRRHGRTEPPQGRARLPGIQHDGIRYVDRDPRLRVRA